MFRIRGRGMNKRIKQILSLIIAGSLLLSACGTEEGTTGAKKPDITDEGYIDTLTPKNDFYGYINAPAERYNR